ncbi:putative hydrolase [Gordonia araii NBRC 100433]|uniref:Putative hydrolase n=1 Tax=Gordonia araii NBRC 100433 TaxID=1073574 RepID=G7H3X8_9ACTN|nr:serine hydrolase [Gordonia araii]NNG98924.1 beta-lactamase family protein [Gordonia araii NBRC 100433]GAB10553.1 putative hydrolase [Gordonia araii NBRC 100433]
MDDLSVLTDIGDEEYTGEERGAVEAIWSSALDWYRAGQQPALQVCVRRDGRVLLNRAVGHAWGGGPADPPDAEQIPVTVDTPYCCYSAGKGLAAAIVLHLVERGVWRLDDRVTDFLPEYGAHGKGRTTIDHVLTHRAGVPLLTGPKPDPRRMRESEYARNMLRELRPIYPPGTLHMYHGLTWGPLVRELVAAATGRSIRDIAAREFLDPFGFRWNNFGVDDEDVPLVAPSHVTGHASSGLMDSVFRKAVGGTMADIIPISNSREYLTDVVPSSNLVSTAFELSRFAEFLRRGGELDGHRVLDPSTIPDATRQRRRLRPDVATGGAPLRWGTGFMLGAKRSGPFGADSEHAFGNTGLTQIVTWADPSRRLAVGIVSSGKPVSGDDPKRYAALTSTINRALRS